jgi:ankyrin repeat protein
LLSHGADPNISKSEKRSPLHYAKKVLDLSCIKPLLDYGADMYAIDDSSGLHNALHLACEHQDDVDYLATLIEAGINIDARTFYSYTLRCGPSARISVEIFA